jgi:hypothetical protein
MFSRSLLQYTSRKPTGHEDTPFNVGGKRGREAPLPHGRGCKPSASWPAVIRWRHGGLHGRKLSRGALGGEAAQRPAVRRLQADAGSPIDTCLGAFVALRREVPCMFSAAEPGRPHSPVCTSESRRGHPRRAGPTNAGSSSRTHPHLFLTQLTRTLGGGGGELRGGRRRREPAEGVLDLRARRAWARGGVLAGQVGPGGRTCGVVGGGGRGTLVGAEGVRVGASGRGGMGLRGSSGARGGAVVRTAGLGVSAR